MTPPTKPSFQSFFYSAGVSLLLALSVFVPPLIAQTEGPPKTLNEPLLNVDSVQSMLDQAAADATLDETTKDALKKTLEKALERIGATNNFQTETASLKKDSEQGPAEIAAIRKELGNREAGTLPNGGKDSELPGDDATAEMIDARLTLEEAKVADLTRQIRLWDEQLTQFESRPTLNRERILAVTRLLSDAQTQLSKWEGQPALSPKEKAAKVADQTEIMALRAEMAMLEQESLTLDVRRHLIESRRDLATSDVALARDRVATLESRSDALVNARITEGERLVSELGIQAVTDDPLLQQLVIETRDLASQNQVILEKITTAETELKEAEESLEQLRRDAENIRAQIEIGGLEGSFSEIILELRRELPTQQGFRVAAKQRRRDISEARLTAFRMDREIQSLSASQEQLKAILASVGSKDLPKGSLTKLQPLLKDLVETRPLLRKDAAEGNRRLARVLGEIDLLESSTLIVADDLRDYMGEKLLWVASSPPLGANAFTGLRTAFFSLLGPTALYEYGQAITRINPAKWILAVLLALVLLLPRRRLRRYLATSAARTRRISTDRISSTIGALFATLLLALPVPTLLWFFGWIFATDIEGTGSTYALGRGLMAPALLLLVFRFASTLCWPNGVAEVHFRWDRRILDTCHRALMSVIFLYLPSHILLTIWFNGENLAAFQGPGRLVFILSMVTVTLILKKLFSSTNGIFSHLKTSQSWVVKLRRIWTIALILIPLVLAVLASLGHFLTAVALAYQIQNTALVVLCGALADGFLTRWVTLKGRRLALENALEIREQKRLAQKEAAASVLAANALAATDTPLAATLLAAAPLKKEESFIPIEEEETLDWNVVGEQTRHLIRAVVTITVIFGCWFAWSQAIPVLSYLDSRNLIGQVSISDLIWLVFILVITHVIFQNLPSLLEMVFLEALELEAGVRNAISTICQYIVIAIAVTFSIQKMGIDMAQFGWMVAALSVGIGFGLQEVVANFVSGLILLFERPIRVGDIVTVAGVDGTVTKIRIRATTITNGDRKEFIVPNKEFITGTLMNWTLSTPMIRIVIPVGIAYGADLRKAHEILLEIARSQSDILKEPEPVAVFELLGDSALNLSIRCFIAQPDIQTELTHRINTAIYERFSAAGIEVPFPQRDVHIRSIDPSIQLGTTDKKAP